ncbi:MAG TPA: immunoglobulin domain-containing protein [Verrucomicrobiae bacterium]
MMVKLLGARVFRALTLTLLLLQFIRSVCDAASVDAWTNPASGLWQTASNWSSNRPPDSTFGLITITNAGVKSVTIGATTPALNLTITRINISAPGGSTNTLELVDLTTNVPLQLLGSLAVDWGGVVRITNSALNIDGTSGGILNIIGGTVELEDGLIDCSTTTASKLGSASGATGTLNVNGGAMQVFQVHLGASNGATGVLNLSNGVLNSSSLISLGQSFFSTGIVNMSGGELIVTNDLTKVGNLAMGQMTIGGGSANFAFLSAGENPGASGRITLQGGQLMVTPRTASDLLRIGSMGYGELDIAGGTHVIGSEFHVSDDLNATGVVSVTGGALIVTNAISAIGRYGYGEMTIAGGIVQLTNASVGRHGGAVGVLNILTNGILWQLDDLSVGRFANAVGHVLLSGGLMALTNDNIWVGREGMGDLTVSNGTMHARTMFVGMSPDGSNAPAGLLGIYGGLAILSSNLVIGTPAVSTGAVQIAGGTLQITNGNQSGYVDVAAGTIGFGQGGRLLVDRMYLTNNGGQLAFAGGSLQARNLTVANGAPFVVGDGVSPATLELLGGTFAFADGLVISPNATLTGCGTIIGSIFNNGTIATNCGNTIVAPAFTAQPQSQTVVQGSNAVFTASASGTPPLAFQWQFQGGDLFGATASSYTVSGAQPANAGAYRVVVSNTGGSVTSAVAILAVLVPPGIVTQPQDQAVAQGGSFSFSVVASGSDPLSYQWQFNGAILPAATSSVYSRTAAAASDAGNYTVVVTNSAGSVTSAPAGLQVLGGLTIAVRDRTTTNTTIGFTSATGLTYTLEYTDSLPVTNWTPILPGVPGNGAPMSLMDTNALVPMRFYRLRAQ